MLKTAHRSDFDELAHQLDRVVDKMLRRPFSPLRTHHSWTPSINAYRLADCVEICVELAGVERNAIDVSVEPGRLILRGVRATPQPPTTCSPQPGPVHILAMEIDDGAFERVVTIPHEVEIRKVTAEQINGLLWVRLPLPAR